MSDIVERLRDYRGGDVSVWKAMEEAADTITRLTAENEKLRAALEKIVEIRSYRKAEAGELFEIARAALAAAINSWPRIKIHTDGTEDWIELTLTQEKP
jgi:hypothetical protein